MRLSEFDCDPLSLQERAGSQVVCCCLPLLKVLCVCRARERISWGGGGAGGVLMDLSQPGVWRILHHFISKMEMSWLGTSPQQLESGPVVYLFHSSPVEAPPTSPHPTPSFTGTVLLSFSSLSIFLFSLIQGLVGQGSCQ